MSRAGTKRHYVLISINTNYFIQVNKSMAFRFVVIYWVISQHSSCFDLLQLGFFILEFLLIMSTLYLLKQRIIRYI